jgi:hypothetical protein
MIFDSDHKPLISSMNKFEATAYIKFLKGEIERYEIYIKESKNIISLIKTLYLRGE